MNAELIRGEWDESGYWLIVDTDDGNTFRFRCDVLELREVVARTTDAWVDERDDAKALYRGMVQAGLWP